MKYDAETYLMQVGLKSLGFDPGNLDGERGNATEKALAAFTASEAKAASATIAAAVVDVARSQVGIRETSKNQGEGIAKFWAVTSYANGYANREPYCAAFVCWCIAQASKGFPQRKFTLPSSPVAYDFEKWGRANAYAGVTVRDGKPKPGDVFTLATASHVGIVVATDGDTMTTVEGNTNGSGSREGDGVYIRQRSVASARKFISLNA